MKETRADELVRELDDGPWAVWLSACFPHIFTRPVAWFHEAFLDHVWSCERARPPDPPAVVLNVFRGGAKSTLAEVITVALLASGRRRYAIYVSSNQDAANTHVDSIATTALSSEPLTAWHPEMGQAFLEDKSRQSRWNAKRVEFGNGTVVDAAGMDSKVRGRKAGEQRPDLIILDDIDEATDSKRVTQRKLTRLKGILGGGSPTGTLVLFVQNTVHSASIMAGVMDRSVEALSDRKLIGPVPMVADATYPVDDQGRTRVEGRPTWDDVWPIEQCNAELARMGVRSFREENQDETDHEKEGALLRKSDIKHAPVPVTEVVSAVVSVDPSTTAKPGSDECGIVACARTQTGWAVLEDRSAILSASKWPRVADQLACAVSASVVIVEGNQGGDLNKAAIENAQQQRIDRLRAEANSAAKAAAEFDDDDTSDQATRTRVNAELARVSLAGAHVYQVEVVWASEPKEIRARRPAARYQDGDVVHAKPFPKLEREWTGWLAGIDPSPNRLDAATHGLTYLGCIPEDQAVTTISTGAADLVIG